MDQQQTPKLPHSAFVKVNGEDREIFMSFGLLNRLAFIVGDISNLPMLHLTPQMREAVLEEMLHERTRSGKVTKEVALDDADISIEDVEVLLDFAAEHVLDFSLRAIEKATGLQQRNQGRLDTLKSSQAGLASKA